MKEHKPLGASRTAFLTSKVLFFFLAAARHFKNSDLDYVSHLTESSFPISHPIHSITEMA